MQVRGTFEIKMSFEPPIDVIEGVSVGRFSFDKQFSGPLEATSVVHMLGARTAIETSAGYVAVERIVGTLEGRAGSFVVLHLGLMTGVEESLKIVSVPDSGTGELKGIAATITIQRVEGKHHYVLDYTLPQRTELARAESVARRH